MDISTVLDHNSKNVATGAASGRSNHDTEGPPLIQESPDVDLIQQIENQQSSTRLAASDAHSSAGVPDPSHPE